jgi:hypothetical protein
METLELHQDSTSISVQIDGDSTDIMFVIVHRSLRVRTHHKHVLAMSDAACRRSSVRCCAVSPLTATPICKMTIIVQFGIHCTKSICVLLKYNLSWRHSSSCLALSLISTQRCAWTWLSVSALRSDEARCTRNRVNLHQHFTNVFFCWTQWYIQYYCYYYYKLTLKYFLFVFYSDLFVKILNCCNTRINTINIFWKWAYFVIKLCIGF